MFGSTKNIKQTDWSKMSLLACTQLSFEEPASQAGSRQCGPSRYSSPDPTLDKSRQSELCAATWTGAQTSGRTRS